MPTIAPRFRGSRAQSTAQVFPPSQEKPMFTCAAGMTHDDDPGPTRSVRVLRPLPARPAVPKDKDPPQKMPAAQRLGEARKAAISASGDRFGPYIMLGEVGKGGMADVRLAIEERATGGI